MGSIKVVVQRPGEISHVTYINKELFIGECNRLVGGLSTDIMTDCGLWLVIHARTPYSCRSACQSYTGAGANGQIVAAET